MKTLLNGGECWQMGCSIRLHFLTQSYDYFLYHGKSKNTTVENWEKTPDKFHYIKFARLYNHDTLIDLFVSHYVRDPNLWIGEFDAKTLRRYQGSIENYEYRLAEDIKYLKAGGMRTILELTSASGRTGQQCPIIKAVLGYKVSEISLIALNEVYPFLNAMNLHYANDEWIWKPAHMRWTKLIPFVRNRLNTEATKRIVESMLQRNLTQLESVV